MSPFPPQPFLSRRHMLAGLGLAAGHLLTGCGPGGEGDPAPHSTGGGRPWLEDRTRPFFGVLVDDLSVPMRSSQQLLLDRLIRTRPGVDVLTTDALGDPEAQIRNVRFLRQKGAGIFLVFPQDPNLLAPVLREMKAQGATVIVFSKDVPEDACTTAVFADEKKLGQVAGDFVVASLRQKARDEGLPEPVGRVVQITGREGSRLSDEVSEGFLQSLRQAPGVVLVHDAPGNWTEKDAFDRMREALRLQKQFDVVFAHNDLMALGASEAAREAGAAVRDSLLILGMDGVPGKGAGVEMVIESDLDATVYQPPLTDFAWRLLERMLDDPVFKPKRRYAIKPRILTLPEAEAIAHRGRPVPEVE